MKRLAYLIAVYSFLNLVSCAPTITVKTTAPDGTVTETTTKGGVDKDSFAIGAATAAQFANKGVVRYEK